MVWTKNSTYTHIYTNSASGADRSSGSSGPVGVWRATSLAQRDTQAAVAWVLAVDPRHCSKSCQSASAVLHGWERQDSRADFSVFFYTGKGSACQHASAQPHLKAVDSFFITASGTASLGGRRVCLRTIGKQAVITGGKFRWMIYGFAKVFLQTLQ